VNYVIESRIHPPSDLIAGLYTKDSPGGTVGGGIPIRCSSVEIISSSVVFTCLYFGVLPHFRAVVSVTVIAFLSCEHYFTIGFYSYFYSYGLLLKLND